MAKPATDARLAASAKGFSEVHSRGPNWIKTRNPSTGKISLDVGIGRGWHYGAGLEANSAWLPDTGAWQYKVESVGGFRLNARNVLNAGNLVQWTDISGQSINFQPMALNWINNINDSRQQIALPQAITAQVSDDVLYFHSGYGVGRHFKYQAGVQRLNKLFIIDSLANLPTPTVANPYLEIEFIITPSSGVSLVVDGSTWDKKTKVATANAIAFKLISNNTTVWTFAAPMAYDSAGNETPGILQLRKQGANFYCTVRFPKSWIDAATFPIYLDPTVDYQTGASGDDGYWQGVTFGSAGSYCYFGISSASNAYSDFFYFSGVTISAGATIDTAYLSFYYQTRSGTPPECQIYADDQANPSQITGVVDGNGRTKTTASVAFTSPTSGTWYDSPELSTICQELVDSYSYASSSAVQFLVIGPSGTGPNYGSCRQYDYTGNTFGAKLHIEYTEAVIATRSQVIVI